MAAWWNPFSWKVFTRAFSPKVEVVQTATTTDSNTEIEKLKKEIEVLKKTPTTTTPSIKPFDYSKTLQEQMPTQKKSTPVAVPKNTSQPSQPKPQTQNPVPVLNKAEENYSDVAVKLYSDQLEMLQYAMDATEKYKGVYADIKQTWSDRLIQTQIYLNTYPNDSRLIRNAKVYEGLTEFADISIKLLEEQNVAANGVKRILMVEITKYKNKNVSRNDMQSIFSAIDATVSFNKTYSDKIKGLVKEFSDANHDVAVRIDAINNVEVAKRQQDIDDTARLTAETDRLMIQSQSLLQQHQNTINAYKTTYCTATNLGLGQTSIVCQ